MECLNTCSVPRKGMVMMMAVVIMMMMVIMIHDDGDDADDDGDDAAFEGNPFSHSWQRLPGSSQIGGASSSIFGTAVQ